MKMSDVFELPVDCFVSKVKLNAGCSLGFINIEGSDGKDHNKGKDAKAIEKAVNNHDRLEQEVAELRVDCEKSNAWCVDIFNDFSESEVQSMPPSIVGAWNHGKQLLNK